MAPTDAKTHATNHGTTHGTTSVEARPTEALRAWQGGDPEALSRVFEQVHAELRRCAVAQMARERDDHTLQPTALVHELYLRMLGPSPGEWKSRKHFFAFAARAMGQILIDHARKRQAQKRGHGYQLVALDEAWGLPGRQTARVVELGTLLMDLDRMSPRKRQVVEYHCLGQLALPDCAELLGVSTTTVKRDWRFARAWLMEYLDRQAPDG